MIVQYFQRSFLFAVINEAVTIVAGQLKGESVGAYCGGSEVMACTLYHANQYPSGAICPAEIMFNSHFQQPGYHQMWVWCHTVALLNVWSLLCNTFSGKDHLLILTRVILSLILGLTILFVWKKSK